MHTDTALLDLENEFFDSMLVVEPAEAVGYWWVLCECNEAFVFSTEELLDGATCPPCSMPDVIDLAALEAQLPVFEFGHLDTSWMKDALCAEIGHHPFFPEQGEMGTSAREICGRCEVVDECLEWALESFDAWAFLGGTSPSERAEMRREAGISRPAKEPKPKPKPSLRGLGSGVRMGVVTGSVVGGAVVGRAS